MELNAEFDKRAVVQTALEPWVASPLPGVDRRMLDRVGDEVARATTIVRYAPQSAFSAHTHGGGEEFLVLDGVFSDEHGDYGPGMYVRNPPGSSHTPKSVQGCTIFVKLWQMDKDDQEFVRIDTNTAQWQPDAVDGLEIMPLCSRKEESVALMRWKPGARSAPQTLVGGNEILVLDGTYADEEGSYPKGTWLRNPPGSTRTPFSKEGCTIYVKAGHLSRMVGNSA